MEKKTLQRALVACSVVPISTMDFGEIFKKCFYISCRNYNAGVSDWQVDWQPLRPVWRVHHHPAGAHHGQQLFQLLQEQVVERRGGHEEAGAADCGRKQPHPGQRMQLDHQQGEQPTL